MKYQWNPEKSAKNSKNHGIKFSDAVSVFTDDLAITIADIHPDEERHITIGMDHFGRILVVVYTWRDQDIRIISARKATAKERRQYGGKP
ncbi:MAG: BrnT family toxin [Desulfobacteraceae bacterium]|jgi:uncharacterized DUF497 family protein|nr:MAG: BrnT family toxin [Desulfobacteraceae bacterium]